MVLISNFFNENRMSYKGKYFICSGLVSILTVLSAGASERAGHANCLSEEQVSIANISSSIEDNHICIRVEIEPKYYKPDHEFLHELNFQPQSNFFLEINNSLTLYCEKLLWSNAAIPINDTRLRNRLRSIHIDMIDDGEADINGNKCRVYYR